ncbi:MAG: hypothetical protein FJW37_10165 [Acidobacteria bacterium]|nr:hypothetical protein [Acidobacteriota bacterium]
MKVLLRITALALALVAGGVVVGFWASRLQSRLGSEVSRLGRENLLLRDRLEEAQPAAEAPPASRLVARLPPSQPEPKIPESLLQQAAAAEQARESLRRAQASLARLEARVEELEAQAETGSLAGRELSAAKEDLEERISALNRVIDALQNELKAKTERLAQSEITNARLREAAGVQTQRSAELAALAAELEATHRRREIHLNNVARRYRELSEQSRALYGNIANRSEREGAGVAQADLSRIQNLITLAEEDLRQLTALDAQAARIQRKLAK